MPTMNSQSSIWHGYTSCGFTSAKCEPGVALKVVYGNATWFCGFLRGFAELSLSTPSGSPSGPVSHENSSWGSHLEVGLLHLGSQNGGVVHICIRVAGSISLLIWYAAITIVGAIESQKQQHTCIWVNVDFCHPPYPCSNICQWFCCGSRVLPGRFLVIASP